MLTIIYPKDPSDVESHSAPSFFIFVKKSRNTPPNIRGGLSSPTTSARLKISIVNKQFKKREKFI